MEQRQQFRTGSESTVETEATQKGVTGATQRIETPEDLIRLDRESVAVPSNLSTRLAASLQSETTHEAARPWWRRWWDRNPES